MSTLRFDHTDEQALIVLMEDFSQQELRDQRRQYLFHEHIQLLKSA